MHFINILLNIVLALIMFGIGASIRLKDFQYILKNPRALTWGLILQMAFLPLVTIIVVLFSGLNPLLCVGLFIVALCPGGTTSNFISYIVNAEVALSISMTSINSFLILLTIPLLSNFALEYFLENGQTIHLPFQQTVIHIIGIILFPVFLGLLFRHFLGDIAIKLQKPFKYINGLLLACVFGIKFFAKAENGGSGITLNDIILILPFALIIHFSAMTFSYFFSKKLALSNREAITIGIEVGLQNTALALFITGSLIGSPEMSKPALVYALFSFFTTLAFSILTSKKSFYSINYSFKK